MPGIYPVVGRTEAEAREKFDYLQSLIHPSVGLAVLEHTIGVSNLAQYPLHGPVPEMGDTNGPLSRQRLLLEAARRDKLTLWELCLLNAGPRGHLLTIGTPSQIADVMEHWFRNGAADGFNVMPAWLPGSLTDFVDMVIPELQRRGLFRTEYEGTTLRENLGLPIPVSRWQSRSDGGGMSLTPARLRRLWPPRRPRWPLARCRPQPRRHLRQRLGPAGKSGSASDFRRADADRHVQRL